MGEDFVDFSCRWRRKGRIKKKEKKTTTTLLGAQTRPQTRQNTHRSTKLTLYSKSLLHQDVFKLKVQYKSRVFSLYEGRMQEKTKQTTQRIRNNPWSSLHKIEVLSLTLKGRMNNRSGDTPCDDMSLIRQHQSSCNPHKTLCALDHLTEHSKCTTNTHTHVEQLGHLMCQNTYPIWDMHPQWSEND